MPKPPLSNLSVADVNQLRDWMTDTADLSNPGDRQAKLTLDALLVDLAELSVNVEEWNKEDFVVLDGESRSDELRSGSDPDDHFDHSRASAKIVREAIGWKIDEKEAKAI
jgi:hypothetical protein